MEVACRGHHRQEGIQEGENQGTETNQTRATTLYTDKLCTYRHYIVFGWFWLWYVLLYNVFVKVFWCPCMAIYVSVQCNGGLLPDIILLVDPMLLPSGNPFKCHEEVLFCSL